MSGWENFSLRDYFENTFDAVTLVDNDANLIALGEATFGIGHGCANLFYMHISGGVGGGIVIDGRLYRGETATAGEIGHAMVLPQSATSDQHLKLEDLVSVKGLLRRAQALGLNANEIETIFQDPDIGQRVVEETIDLLALRIAQIVSLLDPKMVVLGGRVVRTGGPRFVEAIATRMRHYISPQFAQPIQVVASMLASDSIAIGALALALKSLED
jgi:glucokinase